jgi:two-component system, OmpR family, KDP operon response regulator KdpE
VNLKILVVDDEAEIRKQLKIGLTAYGYELLTAANGNEAIILTAQQQPDLLVLDISLGSEPDGLEVIRRLREWSKTPIIILSVHAAEKIKVEALSLGADDYLTKPFGMEELHARIQAVLRRAAIEPSSNPKAEIRVGELYIDLTNRLVEIEGERVHLTPTEYDLLRFLATHPGKVLTHSSILAAVWGPDYRDMSHYVRVFVNQLRKKLRENPARNIRYILNEPGVGYRFVFPD